MSKKPAPQSAYSRKPRRKLLEPVGLEHFRSFLAAADRVALELLIREGVMTDPRIDRSFYYESLTRLAKTFCGDYAATNLDNVCTYEELDAKQNAAHMIGLALGLRLRGVDLTLPTGGNR